MLICDISKMTRHQTWWLDSETRDPYSGRRKATIKSGPLTAMGCPGIHSLPNPPPPVNKWNKMLICTSFKKKNKPLKILDGHLFLVITFTDWLVSLVEDLTNFYTKYIRYVALNVEFKASELVSIGSVCLCACTHMCAHTVEKHSSLFFASVWLQDAWSGTHNPVSENTRASGCFMVPSIITQVTGVWIWSSQITKKENKICS